MFSSNTSQVSSDATYIEDVFSTYLWTTSSSNDSETIPLPGDPTKDVMVWVKNRGSNPIYGRSVVFDTLRRSGSVYPYLFTERTEAQYVAADIANNYTGTSIDTGTSGYVDADEAGVPFVAWTFRKQPKFFDIQTYTTNSGTGAFATINHNLGSVPGCIIVKSTNYADDWYVYHRSNGNGKYMLLNSTGAVQTEAAFFSSVTDTQVVGLPNYSAGSSYVVYLLAHNAGGFGLTGTDNVITCGSYTGNGAALGPVVNLGYEPQWILVKRATGGTGPWYMVDNMRGFVVNSQDNYSTAYLLSNSSQGEISTRLFNVTSTGFQPADSDPAWNNSGDTYIYVAIRRGPMKVPTDATTVFTPVARTGAGGSTVNISTSFPPDIAFNLQRTVTTGEPRVLFGGKLLGGGRFTTNTTDAFNDTGYPSTFDVVAYGQTSLTLGSNWVTSGRTYVNHILRRAPSFFDEVCYTGTGSATTFNHNLGVAPELMIVKKRNSATNGSWIVYCDKLLTPITNNAARNFLVLNSTQAGTQSDVHWDQTAPTSSVFTVGASTITNNSGDTFVNYLFASCPGVSKIGTYVGSGSDVTVDCGFTSGARFVLIRRILYGTTPDTGNWWVFDSARGITTSNDPALLLNSAVAESAIAGDYVAPASVGFIAKTGNSEINVSGQTYLFLAIA